ncbi:hypothetical protein PsorP6_006799 [Peronosclerospora sorghi]|uniref:Uncharacterized protein n=1 Tax=Peronosclerospora sorghi TaxID=230839 RepID=A0ACC0W5R0_9STRA|nr:hypothetical protein PsorP6_006799 [Peronosclerospora sorghi]
MGAKCEQNNLRYLVHHQIQIRADLYQGLADKMEQDAAVSAAQTLFRRESAVAVFGLDGVHEVKQLVEAHVLGALEMSMYSIECVVSLLEVAGTMNVLEEVEWQAEDAAQVSWLVTGTVHVMLQWDTFPDDLDVLILLRSCVNVTCRGSFDASCAPMSSKKSS